MPLYALACPAGHPAEEFCHVPADRGCRTHICPCGASMAYTLSVGRGLTWFRESGPRTLYNLGHDPVTVRSHEEHKRLMRQAGVDWATGWQTRGTGGWV